jgi:hypothetical protein
MSELSPWKQKKHLTIENGIISKQSDTEKKYTWNEIKQIKKFAGDYILKSDSTELRINTELIEENSYGIKHYIDNLNLENEIKNFL